MTTSAGTLEVNARIVYWGIQGAGKTTCAEIIHAKLRPDHRGPLRRVPTRLDPTVYYESLPIALGNVQGARTQLQILTVPGGPEQAHTRKQLLDRVDGLVIVIDVDPARRSENAESMAELRSALAAYGRSLEELPFVVQYNKRDLGDPYAIEALHRELRFGQAPVFETVASQGQGVLQVLSTISKGVVRSLRSRPDPTPAPAVVEPVAVDATPDEDSIMDPGTPLGVESDGEARADTVAEIEAELVPETVVHLDAPSATRAILDAHSRSQQRNPLSVMEAAILSEGEGVAEVAAADHAASRTERAFDKPWAQLADAKPSPGARFGADLRVVSVGTAERSGDRGVRVPLVLGNDEGETLTVALTVQLDPLLEDDPG